MNREWSFLHASLWLLTSVTGRLIEYLQPPEETFSRHITADVHLLFKALCMSEWASEWVSLRSLTCRTFDDTSLAPFSPFINNTWYKCSPIFSFPAVPYTKRFSSILFDLPFKLEHIQHTSKLHYISWVLCSLCKWKCQSIGMSSGEQWGRDGETHSREMRQQHSKDEHQCFVQWLSRNWNFFRNFINII